MYNRNSTSNCLAAILISAIVGVGVAVLFSLSFIANIIIGLWIVFSLGALIFTIYAIFMLFYSQGRFGCLRRAILAHSKCLIAGIVGTLLTTLVALSSTLVVTSPVSIIIIFLATLFFILMLITFIQMLFFSIFNDIDRQ